MSTQALEDPSRVEKPRGRFYPGSRKCPWVEPTEKVNILWQVTSVAKKSHSWKRFCNQHQKLGGGWKFEPNRLKNDHSGWTPRMNIFSRVSQTCGITYSYPFCASLCLCLTFLSTPYALHNESLASRKFRCAPLGEK